MNVKLGMFFSDQPVYGHRPSCDSHNAFRYSRVRSQSLPRRFAFRIWNLNGECSSNLLPASRFSGWRRLSSGMLPKVALPAHKEEQYELRPSFKLRLYSARRRLNFFPQMGHVSSISMPLCSVEWLGFAHQTSSGN